MSAIMSQCVGRISYLRIHQSRPEYTPVGQGAKQVAEVAVPVAVAEQTELEDFHWPKIMAKQLESLDAKIKEAVCSSCSAPTTHHSTGLNMTVFSGRQQPRIPPYAGTQSKRISTSGPIPRRASPFGTNPTSCPGLALCQIPQAEPTPSPPTGRPTPKPARRSASATTLAGVPSGTNASLHTAAGSLAATRHTQARGAPNNDHQRGQTPLRHSQFGRELANHPDKAWISWLLDTIQSGVSLGYTGPRGPRTAPNLLSAHQNPHTVTAELTKEC